MEKSETKKTVLISIEIEDFQTIISNCVTGCLKQISIPPAIEEPQILTVTQTAEYLSIAVQTVYSLVAKGELPVMKRSKRCYFLKSDLLNYLKQGKTKSPSELESDVEAHLHSKRKGGKP